MRTEISQAKREANFYIQNVEKGKAIDAMETRKRKRADQVWYLVSLPLTEHKINNCKGVNKHASQLLLSQTLAIFKLQPS